jgi:glutaredoxin-related protein
MNNNEHIIQYLKNIKYHYDMVMDNPNNDRTKQIRDFIKKEIGELKDRKILIYPHSVHWNPLQRPQHILREFARKDYICFHCEYEPEKDYMIKKVEDNLYIVNCEEYLLPIIKNIDVTILVTYYLQNKFVNYCKKKKIWLDILDRLDFFSYHCEVSQLIWNDLIEVADVVTYSATNLKQYVKKRKDAILLQNAVNVEDFIEKSKRPTIGYFGAIENWFDCEIVKAIADTNDFNIVLIGRLGIPAIELQHENITLLGEMPYKQLSIFAKNFDIAIIPFKVNDLTNSVSPVKFFEYCSLGLPVISTPIREVKKYQGYTVRIAKTPEQFIETINKILNDDIKLIKDNITGIATNNQWVDRVDKIYNKL